MTLSEPASRHYRRARQDRGAETRARLIAAALDAFGRLGLDGASTRDIARRADANLAAIVYHFGSKEALHRAVAEHVVGELTSHVGPMLAEAEAVLDSGGIGRDEARRLMQKLVEGHIAAMLGEKDAELWARFIMREQMAPSAVFDVLYGFLSRAHSVARRLLGILLDIDPCSDEASVRVFALTGQVMMFRVAQPMVLRTLSRTALDDADRRMIRDVVTEHLDRILGVALPRAGVP